MIQGELALVRIARRTIAAVALLAAASPAFGKTGDAIDLCNFKPVFMEDFHDLSIASRLLDGKHWTERLERGQPLRVARALPRQTAVRLMERSTDGISAGGLTIVQTQLRTCYSYARLI